MQLLGTHRKSSYFTHILFLQFEKNRINEHMKYQIIYINAQNRISYSVI